ncbi:MAG: hypothetical protein WCW62_15835 [Bacteroidales bacterium]|jgi:hypothetical protein
MEDIGKNIETLIEEAVAYGKTTVELAKLKAIDKISGIAASLISKILIGSILFFIVLFLSLGLAFWLGNVFGRVYLGFLAVAGIYSVLAILVHFFLSKWFKNLICNYIIKNALD